MADRDYIGTIDLVEKGKSPKIIQYLISNATNNIMASAYLTSNLAISHNSVLTISGWTERYDVGSNFNATTGIYTAPVSGYYQVDSTINYYDSAAQLTMATCYIDISGAYAYGDYWMGSGGTYIGSKVGQLCYAAAGAPIKIVGFIQTADTNPSVVFGGVYTDLSIYLVAKV